MQIYQLVLLVLVLLIGLLAVKMPVAFALTIAGAVGLILLKGFGYATNVIASSPFSTTDSFTLTIVPMFILMGMFAVRAKIAEHVFAVANYFARRAPGGLGVATIMASAGFSAVSGSSIGTAATMARLSVAEMRSFGYPASLATGIVAVAGTLGVMIPPSTFLVLYAIMTNQSVAQILAAGIFPGLLSATAYIVYIMVFGQRKIGRSTEKEDLNSAYAAAHAEIAAKAHGGATTLVAGLRTTTLSAGASPRVPLATTTFRSLPWQGVLHIGILFAIVLGGMYSGIFTSTESAAIGALAAFVILIFENRREGIRQILASFKAALLATASTTSMVFMIIVGSSILSAFFIAAHVPDAVTAWVTSLDMPPMLTMAFLLLCLIPLGTVLESLSILVITVPILFPIATEFGFNGIWLGILVVKLIEIGMVTPPVGINVFVVAGTTGVKPETVFRGVMPLVAVDIVITTILFLVPPIALFLPSLVQH